MDQSVATAAQLEPHPCNLSVDDPRDCVPSPSWPIWTAKELK